VLTIGMAVDANVLVFERIREELRQEQAPPAPSNLAMKALSAIIDANITTFITATICSPWAPARCAALPSRWASASSPRSSPRSS
jgi:preprotein translocase subunit SecF